MSLFLIEDFFEDFYSFCSSLSLLFEIRFLLLGQERNLMVSTNQKTEGHEGWSDDLNWCLWKESSMSKLEESGFSIGLLLIRRFFKLNTNRWWLEMNKVHDIHPMTNAISSHVVISEEERGQWHKPDLYRPEIEISLRLRNRKVRQSVMTPEPYDGDLMGRKRNSYDPNYEDYRVNEEWTNIDLVRVEGTKRMSRVRRDVIEIRWHWYEKIDVIIRSNRPRTSRKPSLNPRIRIFNVLSDWSRQLCFLQLKSK